MILRLTFAALAFASIHLALGQQPVPCAVAAPAVDRIQMGSISVEVIGKGSPVILIPGLSSPRAVWDGVAPELARNHSVYLVQVNGFGGDDPRDNLNGAILDSAVLELHALIVERKLRGAAVVGHSMGGLLTLMLAKKYPGDVGKALIVDAMPFVGLAFFPGSTVDSIRPQAEAMRDQMVGLYGKPLPEAALQAIARQNALKPESQAKVAAWSAASDMRVSGQAMFEDLTTDLRPDLKGIAAPITVLVPGDAAMVERYRTEYAGAASVTVKAIADSGHFIMLDQPDAFRAALTGWLN
jgi:pimeloyl-ACP methyl ester carboxylesterase